MGNTKKERGCGWTTQATWKQLVDMSEKQYADELKKFPQISTKKRMDLIAGLARKLEGSRGERHDAGQHRDSLP